MAIWKSQHWHLSLGTGIDNAKKKKVLKEFFILKKFEYFIISYV